MLVELIQKKGLTSKPVGLTGHRQGWSEAQPL